MKEKLSHLVGCLHPCTNDARSLKHEVHKLAWNQTRDSAVRRRLLPASTMAHQGDFSNLPDNCPRVSFHHVDDKKYEQDLKCEIQN